MPARIDRLTGVQRARMRSWADEWIARGLQTGEADWAAFEAGVRACYRYAKLAEPRVIVRVPSPVVVAFAGPITASILRSLGGAVGGVVNGALCGAVRDAVGGAVDGAVGGAVDGAVRDAVRDAVRSHWQSYIGGQFWLSWPAWTSFFRDVCRLDLPGDLWDRDRAYAQCQQAACWWWPHEQFVIVSNRPRELRRDDLGRLHSASGPAIAWDGWAIYSWHGTRVPAEWIDQRDNLASQTALTWPNVEQRRAAAEILGWDRVLAQLPVRTINLDRDPQVGDLLEVDLPDAPRDRFLRVRCATGRTFVLPVPRAMQTALEANAWTYGIENAKLLRQLEVRT